MVDVVVDVLVVDVDVVVVGRGGGGGGGTVTGGDAICGTTTGGGGGGTECGVGRGSVGVGGRVVGGVVVVVVTGATTHPAFQIAWPWADQFLPPYAVPAPKSTGGMMSAACWPWPPFSTVAASTEKLRNGFEALLVA